MWALLFCVMPGVHSFESRTNDGWDLFSLFGFRICQPGPRRHMCHVYIIAERPENQEVHARFHDLLESSVSTRDPFQMYTHTHTITLFLRWVWTPPMPGIGCLGKFYIRCPGYRKIGIFRFPEIRISGDLEVQKSENRDFRIPRNPGFRKPDFWNSGKPENPDFRVFWFSGSSEIGTSTNQVKRHRI